MKETEESPHPNGRRRFRKKADDTEADAKFAIKYAYWAVEEAEYRVLDAALARKDADRKAADGS